MNILSDNEMKNITGGSLSVGALAAIIAGVSFVVGIIDGILRPLGCRE